MTIEQLEKEINLIKERNKRVEEDKAWETSLTRRILITVFIYLIIGFYLTLIDVAQPWLNAIVPAGAYILSTLILPFFKEFWKKHIYGSKN